MNLGVPSPRPFEPEEGGPEFNLATDEHGFARMKELDLLRIRVPSVSIRGSFSDFRSTLQKNLARSSASGLHAYEFQFDNV